MPEVAPPAPMRVALLGLCPRCGERTLFAGVLRFAHRCPRCGLDLDAFNVGDGAATFLIFIVGCVILGLAMWVELSYEPPWWVHVLLWLPLTVALTMVLLRFAKGLLIALEFRHSAGPGRLSD